MIRLIDPAAFRTVPWKNGGGTATDIAAAPAADGGIGWRVATAAIEKDGPFSDHIGITRIFTVVEGPGVALDFGNGAMRILGRDEPLRFAGAPAPFCRLRGGQPATAFNLMTRDGQACGDVAIRRGPAVDEPLPAADVVVLLALEGAWRLTSDGEAAVVEAGGAAVIEGAEETAASSFGRGRAAVAAIRWE